MTRFPFVTKEAILDIFGRDVEMYYDSLDVLSFRVNKSVSKTCLKQLIEYCDASDLDFVVRPQFSDVEICVIPNA